jgi:hypothetical protein
LCAKINRVKHEHLKVREMKKIVYWEGMTDRSTKGLSNGYSRQMRQTRSLLPQIWQGESHFFQKWHLANVGESGESSQNILANVSESRKTSWGMSAVWRVTNISEKGHFGKCEYSPKVQKFWRVFALAKFACKLPLLSKDLNHRSKSR